MSRSRRKTPIVGHTTCGSEREDKKLWHQRWRTRERTALTSASPEALSAHLPLLENQASSVWSMGKDGRSYWPVKRQALAERGLRRYYQTAFDDGYVPRVMPYVWRIIWTVGGLMAVTAVLPTNTGRPAFDALVVFSTWYPIGVMLLVFASRPLGRLIRQRAQERRK